MGRGKTQRKKKATSVFGGMRKSVKNGCVYDALAVYRAYNRLGTGAREDHCMAIRGC